MTFDAERIALWKKRFEEHKDRHPKTKWTAVEEKIRDPKVYRSF